MKSHLSPSLRTASPVRLLLLDDRDETFRAFEVLLEPFGHDLVRARTSEETVNAVLTQDFALVLVNLQTLGSLETATQLKNQSQSGRTPVLFLTADPLPMAIAQAYECGAVDVLVTPVNPAELQAKIAVFSELFQWREQLIEQAAQRRMLQQREDDLEERNHLLALHADVGVALSTQGRLQSALTAVTQALVQHLDAAFARIWTVSNDGTVLELQASAGLYTHLDGPHGKIRVGQSKIGRIAAEQKPHLTNQVIDDPQIGDQAWARQQGLVAFAGYPILIGKRLIGVMAAFAQHPLSDSAIAAMHSIAGVVAQTIERLRAEEQVRATATWLSTTLASIGDGVIATDAKGCVAFLNPVAETLTGWSSDEASGKNLDLIFPILNEETRRPVESPVTKVLREGVIVGMANHTLLIRRDGREIPIDDSASPIRTSNGDLTGVVLVFRDVTEKQRGNRERARLLEEARDAHRAAQTALDHLHSLFMQAPVPICILRGPSHHFELTNPMYLQLAGNHDLIGKPLREGLPGVIEQGFVELLDQVYRTGKRFVGTEVPVKLATAGIDQLDEAIVDFVYEPYRDTNGNVIGILVFAANVTAAVRTRQNLEQTLVEAARLNEQLGQAEFILRSLVDNLPELAWSALPDGHIDFYNRRWYEYTGTIPEEMEGWGWEKVHDPELLPAVVARWRYSIETGKLFEMEFPLRGADGVFRWFLTRVQPLRDGTGKIVRWIGTNTNIHQQREMIRKTEEVNLAKDVFLATASHELRTPLNAVLGWARMLRSGQLDPSEYLRAVETIERNAQAQVKLIEDILDGSRIITGKLHLEICPLDMTALVRAALDAVCPAAEAKQIKISVVIEPAAARIVGDPDRLQQIVWNLVNNAIKFTPKGGQVEVRLERVGTNIELKVRDTGQGIHVNFLPHVFDRFRQAEESTTRRHGGLGLGLALVRHLVEAHGGTVRAESEGEGKGAMFCVTLPVQAVFTEEVTSTHSDSVSTALLTDRLNLTGVTVLVVDDEADARALVATVLRTQGAEVTTAPNAERGLELLTTTFPMILLSDIGMPITNGYDFIRQVRKREESAGVRTPAVALTAYAREEDRRLALEAGFDLHVSKPVEPAELLRVVASLVPSKTQPSWFPDDPAALGRADPFLKFRKLLELHGIYEALHLLNSRTSHRFTGIYRFDPPTLRNIYLVDAYAPLCRKSEDVPLAESYCSIVGEREHAFTTEDARRDDRLRTHPARDNVISYCGTLLRDEAGKPFGTLCHFDLVPCDIPLTEMSLMEAAAPYLIKNLPKP